MRRITSSLSAVEHDGTMVLNLDHTLATALAVSNGNRPAGRFGAAGILAPRRQDAETEKGRCEPRAQGGRPAEWAIASRADRPFHARPSPQRRKLSASALNLRICSWRCSAVR